MKVIYTKNHDVILVDDEDYVELSLHTWYVSSKGYAQRNMNTGCRYGRSTIKMARQIMQPIDGMQVDHINGDKLDNRRSNLRIVSNGTNSQNKHQSNNTSGYKGVHEHQGKFRAQIGFEGKKIYLGQYSTAEMAAIAYDQKARELFGPQALTNFHGPANS